MNIGDKVKFLDEQGGGTIVKILPNGKVIIEDEHGFETEHRTNTLVLDRPKEDYKLNGIEHNLSVKEKLAAETKERQLEEFYRKTRSAVRIETPDELEVDLHIENLIESHKGMPAYQILDVQMANFKRELNVAIRKKIKKLIIIHGVGEGVLKSAIRKELYDSYPSLEFHDADYRKYGHGATEILLHSHYKR